MLELPPEMHVRIAESLPQADLFNFRLSCKTMSNHGHSVLFSPQKASRLYIHPTTIQQFIDICHDDALMTKVTTVVVLGDSMVDLHPSRGSRHSCHYPWSYLEAIDSTVASSSEKGPFRDAYKQVIAATNNLINLQKIVYETDAEVPGLNSTSDVDIANQSRDCFFKAAKDAERPLEWSDTEFIIGLALNVPKITHIDAQCGAFHSSGDTKSFDLLMPEGKSTTVRKDQKSNGKDWVARQIFEQLNLQLRSITFEAMDNGSLPFGRNFLGPALLQRGSSIRNVEVIISDVSINGYEMSSCMQACRHLKSLCSFRVRLLGVDPMLLSADRRVDDDDLLAYAAALQCASVFKYFLLQHAKTLETCVIDSIVSTSEHQLNTFAGRLKGFSATGKNAQMCFRTYTCKPPATREGNTDDLRALRIVMETE
ncbi:hypothetical protein D0867_14493 [Hortaea werneckii]|uniref:F-box domain-containing protein n=1 Tax=Hortaea werneckii TaxID=91943 RepID=A0A3M6XPC1_HORWE|nr:hypothetical protein D0867_14493 [Hortaea werneckii]RMY08713.1 hypothetical protein D0866_14722 [Hortaea werneckii]